MSRWNFEKGSCVTCARRKYALGAAEIDLKNAAIRAANLGHARVIARLPELRASVAFAKEALADHEAECEGVVS